MAEAPPSLLRKKQDVDVFKAHVGFKPTHEKHVGVRKGGLAHAERGGEPENGFRFVLVLASNLTGWVPDSVLQLVDSAKDKKVKITGYMEGAKYQDFFLWKDQSGVEIRPCPQELMRRRKPLATWTIQEANWWFYFVRVARDDLDLLRRLTALAFFHRNMTAYVKRNLAPTRHLWGDAYFIWEFTKGVQYSLIAECWFRAIVHHVGMNTIALVKLPEEMLKVAEKRVAITYNQGDSNAACFEVPYQIRLLEVEGLSTLCKAVQRLAGDEPIVQQLLFHTVLEGVTYEVANASRMVHKADFDQAGFDFPNGSDLKWISVLNNRVEVDSELLSHPLFAAHQNPPPGSSTAWVFRVKRKQHVYGSHHVLVVWVDGAVMCACRFTYQHGRICKHCNALVLNGYTDFSPLLAIDECYALGAAHTPDTIVFPKLGVAVLHVTQRWDWAVKIAGPVDLRLTQHAVHQGAGDADEEEEGSASFRSSVYHLMAVCSGNKKLRKLAGGVFVQLLAGIDQKGRRHGLNQTQTGLLANPHQIVRGSQQLGNKTTHYS
jgi:hypothetical protein